MQPKASEATQHTRPSAKRRSLELSILWPLLKLLLKPPEFSGFPIGIFDSASEFSIGGRRFIRLGASPAKCLAQNCTTRGGQTFNGKGYAALPLSQHAQACVRA